jgi:hypothetical protein
MRAGSLASLIVFVVEVGYQVDTRVHQVPPLPGLRVVEGVRRDLVRAAGKPPHAIISVIEVHGVMARVAPVGSSLIPVRLSPTITDTPDPP